MSERKTNRASFGTTRKLPSGRYQARYPGPYAEEWIEHGGTRGRFAPRTKANNEDLLAVLLAPLYDYPLNTITPAIVRAWYSRARQDLTTRLKRRAEEARLRPRDGGGDSPLPAPHSVTDPARSAAGADPSRPH